jgi:hypothetical protein
VGVCVWVCGWVLYCVGVLIMCILKISSATLAEVFPCFFLSCKENSRVKLTKTGHGQHPSKFVTRVVLLLIVLFYVLFVCTCVLPPSVNPIAVHKHIISSELVTPSWLRGLNSCIAFSRLSMACACTFTVSKE